MGVGRTGRGRTASAGVLAAVVLAMIAGPTGAGSVAAQSPTTPSSTSTSTTTTATAGAPGSDPTGATTTTPAPTATPPAGGIVPPAVGPGAVPAPAGPGTDAIGAGEELPAALPPGGQPAFDPASRDVLAVELAAARRRLRTLERRLAAELRSARTVTDDLGRIEAVGAAVDASETARAVDASTAREELRRTVVGAYVLDGVDLGLMGMLDAVDDLSRARVFLRSLADGRRAALDRFTSAREDLGSLGRRIVDDSAPLRAELGERQGRSGLLALAAEHERAAVAAYEAGSQVAVAGFRFPVLGPVAFADSWGFPRMVGTASAHWHEGTDIIAPLGRELVAAEDGVLHDVGQAGLGGTKLWVLGRSGTDYYYAHLTAYAPGVADGVPVVAGQVVGYLGDTGNAQGGVPHLHFEIHPAAGRPVNPYPLLWTSLGRPVLPPQSEVLAGPVTVLPPGVTIAP